MDINKRSQTQIGKDLPTLYEFQQDNIQPNETPARNQVSFMKHLLYSQKTSSDKKNDNLEDSAIGSIKKQGFLRKTKNGDSDEDLRRDKNGQKMLNNFLDSQNRQKAYKVLEDSFGDTYENLNKTLPKENIISWE